MKIKGGRTLHGKKGTGPDIMQSMTFDLHVADLVHIPALHSPTSTARSDP